MGIDHDSRLILGWEIKLENLLKLLIKNKIGTCLESYDQYTQDLNEFINERNKNDENKQYNEDDYLNEIGISGMSEIQCLCKCCFENNTHLIPENIYIIETSPYYDCSNSEKIVFISLTNSSKIPGNELLNIINNESLINSSYEFAKMLGTSDDKIPSIISVTHVS